MYFSRLPSFASAARPEILNSRLGCIAAQILEHSPGLNFGLFLLVFSQSPMGAPSFLSLMPREIHVCRLSSCSRDRHSQSSSMSCSSSVVAGTATEGE